MEEQISNGFLEDIFKIFFPVTRDPKDSRDYMFGSTKDNQKVFGDIPATVSYEKACTWPMNQGRLGSCVGCAGTAIIQCHENMKNNNRDSDLSEQYLYWECEKIDDHPPQGTYPKCAMQVLKNKGIPEEVYWPYVPVFDHGTTPDEGADRNALKRRITSYYRITTLKQLLKALSGVGPVLCTINIFDYWSKAMSVIDVEKGFPLGLHAIAMIGYDLDRELIRFMNSWGWEWGEGGAAWMTFDYFRKYKVDCWVPVVENK